jgi:hypothetical protein
MKYKKEVTDKKWYEEISLGVRKVSKIGYGLGFNIPKYKLDRHKIKHGDELFVICLRRIHGVRDELSKSEQIQFEAWKSLNDREKIAYQRQIELLEKEV